MYFSNFLSFQSVFTVYVQCRRETVNLPKPRREYFEVQEQSLYLCCDMSTKQNQSLVNLVLYWLACVGFIEMSFRVVLVMSEHDFIVDSI